ncbi:MAG TPA: cupin domain-containing protein [Magnetospirillaceae bacterium]|nr:cupin domain-containing protein [Magnetospirillaceae bacterium]
MAHEGIHATVKAAQEAPKLGLAALLLAHGSMELEYYAPHGHDTQMPHDRDELYVVISGHGWFRNGEVRHEFGPNDVLFVPAKTEHRFEQFSDDFATWVIFWGPQGGER